MTTQLRSSHVLAALSAACALCVPGAFAQTPTLVAHYPLNDTGPTCNDTSGNNLSGMYMGGTQGQGGAAAGTGTSVDFNGTGDHALIPGAPLLDQLLNDFTAMAWINLEVFPAGASIMRVFGNQGPTGSWSFGVRGNLGLRFTTHAVLDYDIAASLTTGQWHHVAVVMDASNSTTFYLDGALLGTVVGTQPARTPNANYVIGSFNPGGGIPEYFNGNIDDVQVYRGALSAAEVGQLYGNPGSTLGGGGGLGVSYCGPAVVNSSGQSAVLSASGSVVASQNDVTLTASQVPANQFGFFLTSSTQGLVMNPGGSNGNLCLAGVIGRYVAPGQIQNAGPMGEFSLLLNLGQTPAGSIFVTVLAGETRNFQAWFRDIGPMGQPQSNFTDGRSVTFQ